MELGKLGIDLSNNRSTFIHQNRSVSPRGSNCNSIGNYSQLGAFQQNGNAQHMLPTAFEDLIKLKKEVSYYPHLIISLAAFEASRIRQGEGFADLEDESVGVLAGGDLGSFDLSGFDV